MSLRRRLAVESGRGTCLPRIELLQRLCQHPHFAAQQGVASVELEVVGGEARGLYKLVVSTEVIKELAAPEFRNGDEAIRMLTGLHVLDPTPRVYELAELFVDERVMPSPASGGDSIHVAIACVFGVRRILSWNVRHLANPNKRRHLAVICKRAGFVAPEIVTPDTIQSA